MQVSTLLSTANPNLDGSGVVVPIVGGSNPYGTRIDWIRVKALGSTSAGMIRLFLGTNSVAQSLLAEIPVQAVTPSGTVKSWEEDWYPTVPTQGQASPFSLTSGQFLWASTQNGEQFKISVFGGNY